MKKRQSPREMTESEKDALTVADGHDVAAWGKAVAVAASRSAKPAWIREAKERSKQRAAVVDKVPVPSSIIKSVGYDDVTETLQIHFSNGRVYHYLHVPLETYNALLAAGSVAAFFDAEIRDKYRAVEIAARE